MADVQLENGYCKIANIILDKIAGIRIPGEARQVLDVVIRKTYGWNKKEDIIPMKHFVEITGLSNVHVCQAIRKLKELNIIFVTEYSNKKPMYGFNKDFETWRPLPKKVRLPNTVTNVTEYGNNSPPNDISTFELQPPKDTSLKTIKDKYIVILERWNEKKIVVHRKMTDKIKTQINALTNEGYTVEEILEAIDNYAEVQSDNGRYFFNHPWCLELFLKRGAKQFFSAVAPLKTFLKNKYKDEDEKMDSLFGGK